MNPLLVVLFSKVFDSIAGFLDPAKKAEAELAFLKFQQETVFKEIDTALALSKQQTDINLEEAKSENMFKAGWRPWIGWVFGMALFFQFLVKPAILTSYVFYTGHALGITLPGIEDNLWELGAMMLGLGGMRTVEKLKK